MTTPPTLAPSWFTLTAFVAHLSAREAGQQAFAVVGFNGESEGVLLARDLNRVLPAERDSLRVRDICQKRLQPLVVTPDTPLREVVPAIRAHGGVAVVVEDSRLIATLVTADLDHAAGVADRRAARVRASS
jgi:CBS domain-containing protein